jgi:TolB-like protein
MRRATLLLGAALLAASAAGAEGPARVAVFPFENLSGKADAGELLTRVFFSELASRGSCQVIEPGVVDAALDSLGIRNPSSLTSAQLRAAGDTLRADRIVLGSVLESGTVRGDEGDLPSVGLSIRLVDPASGTVLWTGMKFRSGDDHETLFGWGRERSPERLASKLARDLVDRMTRAAPVIARQRAKGDKP